MTNKLKTTGEILSLLYGIHQEYEYFETEAYVNQYKMRDKRKDSIADYWQRIVLQQGTNKQVIREIIDSIIPLTRKAYLSLI